MTARLLIEKVGGGTLDFTDLNPSIRRRGTPFFDHRSPLIAMGRRFDDGAASQGRFEVVDPQADLPKLDFTFNVPGHKRVWWIEDASGSDIWLAKDRLATYEGGRGVPKGGNEVHFRVTTMDANLELRYMPFFEAVTRPAETDTARLYWLAGYILNGASSTAPRARATTEITIDAAHLAPNTNTVTMPAKTYPIGTQAEDVIRDCAETAGKRFGVVRHHAGGSHDCLLYIVETDHATYPCAIKISDQLAEWDPEDLVAPVVEPHWERQTASTFNPEELLSGLLTIWGTDQTVFSEIPANVTQYDDWIDVVFDSDSETEAQAQARSDSQLSFQGLTHVTHRPSIILRPDQVHLITEGMSIQMKSAAAFGGQYLGTWQTRRIAECIYEPREDGNYWVHLELDRTPRRAVAKGKAQPAATTPQPPGTPGEPGCEEPDTILDADDLGVCPIGSGYTTAEPNGACPGADYAGDERCHVGAAGKTYGPFTVSPGSYSVHAEVLRVYNYGPYFKIRAWATDSTATNPPTAADESVFGWVKCQWVPISASTTVPTGYDQLKFSISGPFAIKAGATHIAQESGDGEDGQWCGPPPASDDSTGSEGEHCSQYACADHKHPLPDIDGIPEFPPDDDVGDGGSSGTQAFTPTVESYDETAGELGGTSGFSGNQLIVNVPGENRLIVAFVSSGYDESPNVAAEYTPDSTAPSPTWEAFTLLAELAANGDSDDSMYALVLWNPTPTTGSGRIRWTLGSGAVDGDTRRAVSAAVIEGYTADPTGDLTWAADEAASNATGAGSSSVTAAAEDIVLAHLYDRHQPSSLGTATGTDQTLLEANSGSKVWGALSAQPGAGGSTTSSFEWVYRGTSWGFNHWIVGQVVLPGIAASGDTAECLTEPLADDCSNGDPSGNVMARADHVHPHGDVDGLGPYHAAHGVTYDNSSSGLSSTKVQGAIDELAAGAAAGYVLSSHGGEEVLNTVADAGAAYEVDASLGNWHDLTLTENLTLTLTEVTTGVGVSLLLLIRPDGNSITWPASVVFPGDEEPDLTGVDLIAVSLITSDGGTTWLGAYPGSGGEGAGEAGPSTLPLTAVVDGEPVLIWDTNNSLIPVEA